MHHAASQPLPTRAGTLRAITAMVGAIFLFGVMTALIKTLGDRYPVNEIVFARSLFAFLPLAPFIIASGGWEALKTRRPRDHMMRSFAGLAAMFCSFTAVALLPLAEATAIGFAAPLFMTALAVPLLGEAVGWRRWSAVLVGFLGVLLILRPGAEALSVGAVVALAGAFFYSLAMIAIRRMGGADRSITIVFYFTLTCTVAGAVTLPFSFVMPDAADAVRLVAIGLLGGCAQVLLTTAYRLGPVSVVAPFDYTAILWALIFGWMLWGHVPDGLVLAGVAVVASSGLYILYRETRRGIERPRAPANPAQTG